MQWSNDRNGGFSSADPESLYLPTLSDAVYGFSAVNVESSLSTGPRSCAGCSGCSPCAIGPRSSRRTGSLSVLPSDNPSVLAYLRRDRETSADPPVAREQPLGVLRVGDRSEPFGLCRIPPRRAPRTLGVPRDHRGGLPRHVGPVRLLLARTRPAMNADEFLYGSLEFLARADLDRQPWFQITSVGPLPTKSRSYPSTSSQTSRCRSHISC